MPYFPRGVTQSDPWIPKDWLKLLSEMGLNAQPSSYNSITSTHPTNIHRFTQDRVPRESPSYLCQLRGRGMRTVVSPLAYAIHGDLTINDVSNCRVEGGVRYRAVRTISLQGFTALSCLHYHQVKKKGQEFCFLTGAPVFVLTLLGEGADETN